MSSPKGATNVNQAHVANTLVQKKGDTETSKQAVFGAQLENSPQSNNFQSEGKMQYLAR
jgi:hypothetical protein